MKLARWVICRCRTVSLIEVWGNAFRRLRSVLRNVLGNLACLFLIASTVLAAPAELGQGFFDHGVVTSASKHRGVVATCDEHRRNHVLAWLSDHRGGYELLMVDALTGRSEEFAMPFPVQNTAPHASLLSSRNRFYTHFNGCLVEFHVARREFTFVGKTEPAMAMSFTEDDEGVIWCATYPRCGLIGFNPATAKLTDYGSVHGEKWSQYPAHVAADDTGWIYVGIGTTRSQIVAFNPRTRKAKTMIREGRRDKGYPYLYRNVNGKVYGRPGDESQSQWLTLYRGQVTRIGEHARMRKKKIVSGSQNLFYKRFPDGQRLESCDFIERKLVVQDPGSRRKKVVTFEYGGQGAPLTTVAVAPNQTVCGGTMFPMRFFCYDPATSEWLNWESFGQSNTVLTQSNRLYVGGYSGGFLLAWNPVKKWNFTHRDKVESNPRFLTDCKPTIDRPHDLIAIDNGQTVVMAGTPGYGYTGGGLLFWNRETHRRILLDHRDILPGHSTMSLVELADGRILGGTTTRPGTGGQKKVSQSELYLLAKGSWDVVWHEAIFPQAQEYSDLCLGPNGCVWGIVDHRRFFVFDPVQRKVVHQADAGTRFGSTVMQQGPRVFVRASENEIYMLFMKGVVRVDPVTFELRMVAESPVPIRVGGDFLQGQIFFGSGSRLYSYRVSE